MKAIFSRQALMTGISLTERSVSASGALPILSNLLLDATEAGVNMIATDLESFARVSLEGRVEEPGRITMPAKMLGDIVRLLPDQDIALVAEGSRVTLSCGRNVYQLTSMSADDFPEWPKAKFGATVTLRQTDFKRQLHNTSFAIPTRDPRKVLMGALFELSHEGLGCVATDGRKLGRSVIDPVEVKGAATARAIIPGRTLSEVDRAIGDEGELTLEFGERQVAFTIGKLTLLTTLIEGNFPNYQAVIPDSFKRMLELPKAAFDEAIMRAGVLAERKFNSIILSFGRNAIEIKSSSTEEGSYEGHVEVSYDGEPFKIAFSHQYLHEVFKIVPEAIVRMKVKDSSAPVVFECESDPNSLYLVMPVRMHDLETEDEEETEEEEE